jgi:hypothetical protein
MGVVELIMCAAKIEVGDVVVINGVMAGTVLDKFPSATGDEIYDISVSTNWGAWRIAVLGSDIAVNHAPLDGQN